MLKNFIRAKVSTHGMLVAFSMFAFAAHRFLSDPHAADWLRAHWVVKDLFETAAATLVAYGIYTQPTKPAE